MNTKQSITLIKLIQLWQSLKPRRMALGFTQPQMADALDLSLSAYTHYEASAEKLTVDRLMQIDGMLLMLEKSVGKPVDKNGDNSKPTRIQAVLPKSFTLSPTSNTKSKLLTGNV